MRRSASKARRNRKRRRSLAFETVEGRLLLTTAIDFSALGLSEGQSVEGNTFSDATFTSENSTLTYTNAYGAGLRTSVGSSWDVYIDFATGINSLSVRAGDGGGDYDAFALSVYEAGTDAFLGTFSSPLFGGPSEPEWFTLTVSGVGTIGRAVFDPGNSGSLPGTGPGSGGVIMTDIAYVVVPTNQPPDAVDDSATTLEDSAVTIDVAANDTDPDGNLDPSSAIATSGPLNGTLANNGDGTFTYTPNADFNGSDSFTYEICDTAGECDSATVDITIDPVADIAGDSDTMDEDTSSNIDVLANDSFEDPSASVSSVTQGANGSVVIEGDGTVTYTPNPDFNGADSFTYTVTTANDSSPSNTETATVTVAVNSVIDVLIDIKPGSDPNSINLGSNGVLPVAILSTSSTSSFEYDELYAPDLLALLTLDDIAFGDRGAGHGTVNPLRIAVEDVNDDGIDDLIMHFSMESIRDNNALDEESTDAVLTAEWGGPAIGVDLSGSDSVRMVPLKGKSGK